MPLKVANLAKPARQGDDRGGYDEFALKAVIRQLTFRFGVHRPLCSMCAHLVHDLMAENERSQPSCLAFPNGIPDDIFYYGYDHRNALGVESTLFKKLDNATESDVETWAQEISLKERSYLADLLTGM